jgi:hypothetical protein
MKVEEGPPVKHACPEPNCPPPGFSANKRTQRTSQTQAYVAVVHLEDYKALDA